MLLPNIGENGISGRYSAGTFGSGMGQNIHRPTALWAQQNDRSISTWGDAEDFVFGPKFQ